jgi:hypothetical protein
LVNPSVEADAAGLVNPSVEADALAKAPAEAVGLLKLWAEVDGLAELSAGADGQRRSWSVCVVMSGRDRPLMIVLHDHWRGIAHQWATILQ